VPSELAGHGSDLTLINWTMVTTQLGQCPSQGCNMLLAASSHQPCSATGTVLRNLSFVCSAVKTSMQSTVPERRHYIPENSNVYKTKERDIPNCLEEAVSLKKPPQLWQCEK
jgi:hypothetical protein